MVLFRTVIGPHLPGSITINELTTVAAAFSMASLLARAEITGAPPALRSAWEVCESLVSARTGAPSEALLAASGEEDGRLRRLHSLGNLLAACVRRDFDDCPAPILLVLATRPDRDGPEDTFHAIAHIARAPARNVDGIYVQSQVETAYEPTLQHVPNAWTLAPR
jgi:hypothetical protein